MRKIVVTGASRGLGLAIARKLTCSGYHVIAIARSNSRTEHNALQDQDCFSSIVFDLNDVAGLPDLVARLRRQFGSIHGLVNNAGLGTHGALALMSNSSIENLIQLNTLSPIVLTKYIVRGMMADGGGRVVNVASIAASTGYSGLSVYGATKASMIGFTRSLAREVGRMGVTVNAIAPGFLETDMTRSMSSVRREKMAGRTALKRLPLVDEVADAVEFLLSDKANGITGTVLTVDAGGTA